VLLVALSFFLAWGRCNTIISQDRLGTKHKQKFCSFPKRLLHCSEREGVSVCSLFFVAGVHTYLRHVNASDPSTPVETQLPHIAAFMLAQAENWYYFGSTGWWDDDFVWNDLYDKGKCGVATRQLSCLVLSCLILSCLVLSCLSCANVAAATYVALLTLG
jgi:hypothetical protein